MNINPNGDVYQCCIADTAGKIGNLKDSTLEEVWNNDPMRQLRLDLLGNVQPGSCRRCYEQEENGIQSFRVSANLLFEQHLEQATGWTKSDGTVDDMKLRYWDFRFSNLCNMKCRMCGHQSSSAWHADSIALWGANRVPTDTVINVRDHSIQDLYAVLDEQIDHVEEIYFAGGEPLIMDEHYYILEKLIASGRRDVKIRYNTNLLKIRYKHWDNIELWKNFNTVVINASIDAMGPRAEYIRSGTVWNTIDENMRRLMAVPNVYLHVSPTIQVLNILHIPDFVDYLLSIGLEPRFLWMNNVLTNPSYYHVKILTDDIKDKVTERFAAHIATIADHTAADYIRRQYDSMLSYMRTPDTADNITELRNRFLYYTKKLDELRSEKLLDVFPELANLFDKTKW